MASPFFQAWADWISALNAPASESSGNAKRMLPAEKCCDGTGPECRCQKTSEPSMPNGVEQMELKYQPLRKLTEEQVEEAIRMYQSGLSLAKCAEPFGVSRQSMHDLLKRRIELRDRIEALPRLTDEERSKVQEKRNRASRRYRSKAARITAAQIKAVKDRDKACVKCGAEGVDIDHITPVSAGGQTEMGNLQLLCKPCHIEKTRQDWKGVIQRDSANRSTSCSADSRDHAKTSRSPENAPASTVNDQDCSSRQPESLTLFSDPEGGSSLRMFPDFFPQTVDEISPSFSRRWPTSGFMTSPGECWTADTSECPSGGGVFSSLPDVLEATVPSRFFLSPKAAAGILRRAEKRGKPVPAPLERALRELSGEETGVTNSTGTEPTSEEGK